MTLRLKSTNDIIIYSCNGMINTDKEKLNITLNMNEHYAGKRIEKEIKATVLEVKAVFEGLKAKLTPEELFLINNLCRIV